MFAVETPFAPETDESEEIGSDAESNTEFDREFEDEEKESVSNDTTEVDQLDSLTGNPLPDDVLLFAVPCCGPYDALLHCKYKVYSSARVHDVRLCAVCR